MRKNLSILIVGAGVSGITLASDLLRQGISCTLFEKSAGLGGRLATRRFESGKWDHGLPFIYQDQIPLEDRPIWQSLLQPVSNSERFISSEGFTQVPKKLSQNLNILKNVRITELGLNKVGPVWKIKDASENCFEGDALVLTCPAPQSLELLEKSGLLEISGVKDLLAQIHYRPHLVALGICESGYPDTFDESLGAPVELLVENGLKGLKESPRFLTVYMNEEFSRTHFENSEEVTLGLIREILKEKANLTFRHLELKKWRYSRVTQALKEPFLSGRCSAPMYFIGDGFSGGDLRGAMQSAHALSSYLTKC